MVTGNKGTSKKSANQKQSANNTLADLLRSRSISLERVAQGLARDVVQKYLNDMYVDLMGRRVVRDQMELLKLGLSGDRLLFPEKRFKEYITTIKNTIDTNFGKIASTIDDRLYSLAELETKWTARMLNKTLGVDMFTSGLTDASQIKALTNLVSTVRVAGAPMSVWWGRQATNFTNRYLDTLQIGWSQGLNNKTILESMLLPSVFNKGKEGLAEPVLDIMKGTMRGARALIRTSVQTLANDARKTVYKENDDILKGYVWLATLDDRTSIECAALDGLMWDMDEQPIGHDKVLVWPPVHWNCRSVVTPVLKTFRELGIDIEEIPDSTRSSIDGQVPRKETFETWLNNREKTKPGFAEKVFGKTRADLWAKGKLTVREMTDQTGNVLSLRELGID